MKGSRAVLALLLASLLSSSVVFAEDEETRGGRPDSPREAQMRFLRKRSPDGVSPVPVEKMLEALRHMEDMPRYATALGRALPSRRRASAASPEAADSLGAWTALGPGNIGGRTRALAIHPTTPSTMYAGGVAGGVWKSTDSGGSWAPLTDAMANLAVTCLALTPGNPSVLYAGTGEGFYNVDAVRGGGIFKSTDAGATWTRLAATAGYYYVNDIVVSPNNPNRIYAGTQSGIVRSTDGGASFVQVLAAGAGGCLDLVIRTDRATDSLFASVGTLSTNPYTTIYRNTDAAGSGVWTAVFSEPGMGRTSLALAPSNQSTVYALAAKVDAASAYDDGLHGVFRSQSNGDPGTWIARIRDTGSPLLSTYLLSNPFFAAGCPGSGGAALYSQGWYDNVVAVDPINPDRVWAGGVDLFRSTDGGLTWELASYWWASPGSSRYVHADQHALVFHPQYNGSTNQTLFVGNDGGIFRTGNATGSTSTAVCSASSGVSWSSLNNGYAVTQFYSGAPYPGGTTYFGGTQDNGTVRGTDAAGPNAWTQLLDGDGGYVAVDPGSPSILYAENDGLSIQKSLDGGGTFTLATSGITESPLDFAFITPFVMDGGNSQRLWTGGRRAWRTTNGGSSWTSASNLFTGADQPVTAIAVSPQDGNYVLMGRSSGAIHRTQVGLAATFGTTWGLATPIGQEAYCSSLAFDPTDKQVAYATFSTYGVPHLWKSTNAGATWASLDGSGSTGFPDIPAHVLVVDPAQPTRLFVGSDLGVFTSTDGGGSWMVENAGFANVVTEALSVSGGSLFAFTHGRGAFRVSISTAPTITGATLARQQGSSGSATIATVADDQTPAGSLVVTVVSSPPGITLSSIQNAGGTISAQVAVSCAASPGAALVTLQVTDGGGLTATANLTVNVSPNQPPSAGTYPSSSVNAGSGGTVTPIVPPSDAGSLSALSASAPGFTGALSTNLATGVVTVANAAPAGSYTVTVTATDGCLATATTSFPLQVNAVNTAPTITAAAGVTTARGSAAAATSIATVSDAQTPAGSLTVTVLSAAGGLSVTGIVNTGGAVSANVSASCAAPLGASLVALQVSDGTLTSTTDLVVNVTANTPPVLGTYPSSTVGQGQGTTVTPSAPPSDNGGVSSVSASAPGFSGSIVGSPTTGVLTIAGASPPGSYTVTVTFVDTCGASSQTSFPLQVAAANTAPTITAAGGISRTKASPATTATIATVSDAQTAAGSLVVTVVSAPAGVSVTGLTNTGGSVTASVSASCAAAVGANVVVLQVSDGTFTATANLSVNVVANPSPTVGTYPAASVAPGQGTTVTPSAPPADNGGVSSLQVTAPGFSGTLSGNAATGVVTVSNAGPAGTHTVTVTVLDGCGASTQTTFSLQVSAVNAAPTIQAAPALSRVRGSAATASAVATVSDAETPAAGLVVTAVTVPAGISFTGLVNNQGNVTASVAASCSAPLGASAVVLQVVDGGGRTSTASLTVNVLANPAPTLGTYPATNVPVGTGTLVTPTTAPADNGTVSSLVAVSPGFTGTFLANPATGAVSVSNAGPLGSRLVTVTATDDCGATAQTTFTLVATGANTAPTILGGTSVTRSRGASGTVTLATVSDAESAAGSLTVTVLSTPPGVSITQIVNEGGHVSGLLTASCGAALGTANAVLQVGDGAATATANLSITVQADTVPPTVTSPGSALVWETTCAEGGSTTLASLQTAFPGEYAVLLALVNGGSAVDNCSATTRLSTRLGAVDVGPTTRFPLGPSLLSIRFIDADGNVGTTTATAFVRPQGDVDADGDVDVTDDLLIASYIVGNVVPGTAPFLAPVRAADTDGNGVIDVFDVVRHQSFIVGNLACLLP